MYVGKYKSMPACLAIVVACAPAPLPSPQTDAGDTSAGADAVVKDTQPTDDAAVADADVALAATSDLLDSTTSAGEAGAGETAVPVDAAHGETVAAKDDATAQKQDASDVADGKVDAAPDVWPSPAECANGAACKSDGLCLPGAGACVAGSEADCSDSTNCQKAGKCLLAEGKCVAAPGEGCEPACGEGLGCDLGKCAEVTCAPGKPVCVQTSPSSATPHICTSAGTVGNLIGKPCYSGSLCVTATCSMENESCKFGYAPAGAPCEAAGTCDGAGKCKP